MKLGFIGVGNLASSILRGVIASEEIPADEIVIFDLNIEKINDLHDELGVKIQLYSEYIAENCDYVVVAVKPKDFEAVAKEISDVAQKNGTVIISTAAGTSIDTIKSYLGYDAKVIRIMPNINAAVGESMTALCTSEQVVYAEKEFAMDLCSCFGRVIDLDEKYFSAFTAIAGSAPAFAYMFADALATAGIKYGIPAKTAQDIAAQMLFGSAKQLLESPLSVSELIRNVCSPGGTTIEGVCSLKETGFENSVITAVDKTVKKDKSMSE